MSVFDLFINFIESLGYFGFIYFIFHKRKSISLLFVFVLLKTTITSIHNYYLLPEISLTILSQLLVFLYAYLLNRKNNLQNIFMTLLIFDINKVCITISMLISNIIFSFPFYQGNAYIFLVLLSKFLFYLISYITLCLLNKSNITFYKSNKIILILIILFILELLYSSCIEIVFYNSIFDINMILTLSLINLLVIILCYTFFESQKEQLHLLKLQETNLKNEHQIKINHINDESIKHLSLWKHDINYVFTYIENHIKNQRYDNALKTISIYHDVINNYNLFTNTNNDTLNSILIEYIDELIKNDIHIYISTDKKEVPLSTEHYQQILHLFFNHIIKNCQSDYQKEVWITYYTQSPYFTLSLEYTCLEATLYTLQESIEKIVNQYVGFIKISCEDQKDIIKIIIPLTKN